MKLWLRRSERRALIVAAVVLLIVGGVFVLTRGNAPVSAEQVLADPHLLLTGRTATMESADDVGLFLQVEDVQRPDDPTARPVAIACEDAHTRAGVGQWLNDVGGPFHMNIRTLTFTAPVEFRVYRAGAKGRWTQENVRVKRIVLTVPAVPRR